MTDLTLAKKKAEYYCNYQERSHQEVREKLYSFKLYSNQVEQIIAQLIEEDFLNEERFAVQFAGGKFRIKAWGKIKIKAALKQKRISDYCIKKALNNISDDDYLEKLEQVIEKKIGLESKFSAQQSHSIAVYCMGRGFESELVWSCIKKLTPSKK